MGKDRFFKYTKKQYANDMLKNGTARIGTLYEYWSYDNDEVKDADEGRSSSYIHADGVSIKSLDEFPDAMKKMMKFKDGCCEIGNFFKFREDFFEKGGEMEIDRSYFVSEFLVPNAYIYCVTKEASKKVMQHFGYDACIEILDIDKFKKAIGFQLMLSGLLNGQPLTGDDCLYDGRIFSHEVHDISKTYWFKDERFKHQCEYRMVYPTQIQNEVLKPVFVNTPEISRIIKMHKF